MFEPRFEDSHESIRHLSPDNVSCGLDRNISRAAPSIKRMVKLSPTRGASGSVKVECVRTSGVKRLATFERESEMPDFDVETFVTKLDRMGMKLTAVPLADGKLRVNRWSMLHASEHA